MSAVSEKKNKYESLNTEIEEEDADEFDNLKFFPYQVLNNGSRKKTKRRAKQQPVRSLQVNHS